MCPGLGTLFKLGLLGLCISWLALYTRYSDESKRDAKVYSLPERPVLDGPLKPNHKLEEAVYILKDQIDGPESMVVEGESIYTTLYDGRVVLIRNGKINKEVRFSKEKDCGSFAMEPKCGRPLGIRRLNKNEFVVADAYLGIYAVDMNKGSFRVLVKATTPVEGRTMRFLNDVEVLSEDEILFTDSSSKYDRRHFMNIVLEQSGDGRIYKHRISSGETSLLLDGLFFPNGIQILSDGRSFVFAECSMARLRKYDLSTGKVTSFAENLPGLPDNIRLDEEGTLWVGLAGIRHSAAPSPIDSMGTWPNLRQFLIDVVPGRFWLNFGHKIKPAHTMILQLNQKGEIISSLHDQSGTKISDVSQVTRVGYKLYLGSYHSKFIATVQL